MGLVNNALFIGRSALTAYQSALQVVGNNITNASNPDYVRQNPILSRVQGIGTPMDWMPGNGVQMAQLQRHIDEALEARLRNAFGDRESAATEQRGLERLEAIANELSDTDLSSYLNAFFGAFSALQSDATNPSKRTTVVKTAEDLLQAIKRQRSEALSLRDEANDRMKFLTERADEILTQVAELNVRVAEAESGGKGTANALRDERDALLRELSGYITITVREQEGGAVNVYIGNEAVIQFGTSRGLIATSDFEDGVLNVNVRFADNNRLVTLTSGELEGLVLTRDVHADGHLARLDALSEALIREVNVAHSGGQGLVGMEQVTGTYGVTDPALSLADVTNGLPFAAQNGSFQIITMDADGTTHTTDVFVKIGVGGVPDTTLNDLQAAIDAVAGLSATITFDGKLSITAGNGYTFTFANDSSQVLAALGINTFFTGRQAYDIAVNDVVVNNIDLIAASLDGSAGDGTNARRIADVFTTPSSALSDVSIEEYYNRMVSDMAVTTAAAISGTQASEVIVDSLVSQREAISGVSLDEEALQLIKFERAFQGASRYLTVVDEMITEVLNMAR